jgi:hypothetical protein
MARAGALGPRMVRAGTSGPRVAWARESGPRVVQVGAPGCGDRLRSTCNGRRVGWSNQANRKTGREE